jgi:dephospho-CoA kinase
MSSGVSTGIADHRHSHYAVGLTGGIGSGKSTVSELFAESGVPVIDTDVIAHALTAAEGAAMPEILTTFGSSFMQPDGALNRAQMRSCVYNDPASKATLEAIMHPLIRSEAEKIAQAVDPTAPYLLYVVPLLLETGAWKDTIDKILVVDCSEALQIARVTARSAMSKDQVLKIMGAQATRAQRLAAADDVILNEGERSQLRANVARLHAKYCETASLHR